MSDGEFASVIHRCENRGWNAWKASWQAWRNEGLV